MISTNVESKPDPSSMVFVTGSSSLFSDVAMCSGTLVSVDVDSSVVDGN